MAMIFKRRRECVGLAERIFDQRGAESQRACRICLSVDKLGPINAPDVLHVRSEQWRALRSHLFFVL